MNSEDNIDYEATSKRKTTTKKKVASKSTSVTKKKAAPSAGKPNSKQGDGSNTDASTARPKKQAPEKQAPKEVVLSIHDILKFNRTKLKLVLTSIDDQTKTSKVTFTIPSHQELIEAQDQQKTNSKRFRRLTNIITIGFELKQLPVVTEEDEHDNKPSVGIWKSILDLTGKALRADNLLLSPSTTFSGELTPQTYKKTWGDFLESKNPKTGKPRSNQQRKEARDLLELDAHYAFCAGQLDETQFIQTLAAAATTAEIQNIRYTAVPRSLAFIISSLSNNEPKLEAAKAVSQLIDQIDTLNYQLALEEKEKDEILDQLNSTKQELKETENALTEESGLLNEAEATIEQLRSDVTTAGSIHKFNLDNTQARYKGLLEGDLERHLKMIQTCSEMEPPRTKVIIEKVETTLNLLKRELKWLKDSE